MHRTPVAVPVSLALTALPLLTHALALGEGAVHSRRGEPFEATLEVYAAPAERAQPWTVSVIPDLFSRDRAALGDAIRDIVARVEHGPEGYSQIRLRGTMPLEVAHLSFRVRVLTGPFAQSRRYAFSPPSPRPLRRQYATRHAPHAAVDGTDTVWTVARGDTLWDIARTLARPAGIGATMTALHAANPGAFVNGDIDRLKVGAVLRLPADTAAEGHSPPVPAPAPRVASPVRATSARPAAPATAPRVPGPRRRPPRVEQQASMTLDPALAARLAELDTKFAAIRARYAPTPRPASLADLAGSQPADPDRPASAQGEPGREPPTTGTPSTIDEMLAAPEVPTASTSRAEEPPPAEAPATVQAAPSRPTEPARRAPAAPPPTGDASPAPGMAVFGVAVALLAGAFGLAARRRRRRRARHAEWFAREAARRAEVAEKAGRHQQTVTSRHPSHGIESTEDTLPPPGTLIPEPRVTTFANEAWDIEAEIDVNIAYGRYAEAEARLKDVIASTARNVSARMRLAEIYYITERVTEFTALADELQSQYRAEMADDDWRRLVRMGRVIAPAHPTFAGPRVVNQS